MVGFCILLMIVCIPFYSYTSKGYQFIEVNQRIR